MLTKENITSVKSRGFLLNRGTDCFSGRLISIGGQFTAEALDAVAHCAKQFGNGNVIFTSRLSAEIQGIPFDKIPAAEAFMAQHGLAFGGTGAKIRPITACKGTTCVYGNIDTHALAAELHERFYLGYRAVALPHKFKIGVGGCPNSCMKPSLNDVGIEGNRAVAFDSDKCRGCGKCAVAEACPMKAAVKDERLIYKEEKCIHCGLCAGKCPFDAMTAVAEPVCRIYVGGTWGKSQRIGTPLSARIPVSQVGDMVEKVILWYKENGYAKERLGSAIDRVGLDAFEEALFHGDLLSRKDEILAKDLSLRP